MLRRTRARWRAWRHWRRTCTCRMGRWGNPRYCLTCGPEAATPAPRTLRPSPMATETRGGSYPPHPPPAVNAETRVGKLDRHGVSIDVPIPTELCMPNPWAPEGRTTVAPTPVEPSTPSPYLRWGGSSSPWARWPG